MLVGQQGAHALLGVRRAMSGGDKVIDVTARKVFGLE